MEVLEEEEEEEKEEEDKRPRPNASTAAGTRHDAAAFNVYQDDVVGGMLRTSTQPTFESTNRVDLRVSV